MLERRKDRRIPYRGSVLYGPNEPPEFRCTLTDLSASGVQMETNRLFPPGTRLFLLLETSAGDLSAEGVVVWTNRAPPHLMRHTKGGMGVRFTRVDRPVEGLDGAGD